MYTMKIYTFLLFVSFSQWTSALELKHKHVIKVKNKSYTCLFKLHYEGDVCFQDSTVTCKPNIRKKAVGKNIKLVLEDGTVMSIAKVEISKKKDKMTGCKITSRPIPPVTIKPTTELINRTVTCGFDDDELTGGVRTPVDPNPGYTWAGGIIPYFFANHVTVNDKNVFYRVMGQIEDNTCFRFQKTNRGYRGHHLEITVGTRTCWGDSYAEVSIPHNQNTKVRLHSKYQLADQRRCDLSGLILHELMHVLGVMHTQMRKDRKHHIIVNDKNIINRFKAQFEVCKHCAIIPSIPYDCRSIMHYGTSFLGNGRGPTMTAINPRNCRLEGDMPSKPTVNDWALLRIIGNGVCSQGSGCAYTDIWHASTCEYYKKQGRCTSGWWMNNMHTYCAKTCKCNSGCIFTDNNTNCPAWINYCYIPWYMSTCPKTCHC